MRVSVTLTLLLVLAGLGQLGCPPPASFRVGLVDGTRVVRSTASGKEIRKKIQVESRKLESKLAELQKAVKNADAEVKAMAKKRPATDPTLVKKRKALRLAQQLLRSNYARYQKELNDFGRRLLDELKEAIHKVAMGIKRRLGLDLVVMTSRGEGLWIWPVTDITDQVMQEMDSSK